MMEILSLALQLFALALLARLLIAVAFMRL